VEVGAEWYGFILIGADTIKSCPFENWFSVKPPLPIIADVSLGNNLGEMEEMPTVVAKAPHWYNNYLDK